MAYKVALRRSQCQTCDAPASWEVRLATNDSVGTYCLVHAKRRVAELEPEGL